jgi:hypothetical protein
LKKKKGKGKGKGNETTFIYNFTGCFVCRRLYHPGYYNTQRGAVTGAGLGTLAGQTIGGNTESTLKVLKGKMIF